MSDKITLHLAIGFGAHTPSHTIGTITIDKQTYAAQGIASVSDAIAGIAATLADSHRDRHVPVLSDVVRPDHDAPCVAADCRTRYSHHVHRFPHPAPSNPGDMPGESLPYEYELNALWRQRGSTVRDLAAALPEGNRLTLGVLATRLLGMRGHGVKAVRRPFWASQQTRWIAPGPLPQQCSTAAIDRALANPELAWGASTAADDPVVDRWLEMWRSLPVEARICLAVWDCMDPTAPHELMTLTDYAYADRCPQW